METTGGRIRASGAASGFQCADCGDTGHIGCHDYTLKRNSTRLPQENPSRVPDDPAGQAKEDITTRSSSTSFAIATDAGPSAETVAAGTRLDVEAELDHVAILGSARELYRWPALVGSRAKGSQHAGLSLDIGSCPNGGPYTIRSNTIVAWIRSPPPKPLLPAAAFVIVCSR